MFRHGHINRQRLPCHAILLLLLLLLLLLKCTQPLPIYIKRDYEQSPTCCMIVQLTDSCHCICHSLPWSPSSWSVSHQQSRGCGRLYGSRVDVRLRSTSETKRGVLALGLYCSGHTLALLLRSHLPITRKHVLDSDTSKEHTYSSLLKGFLNDPPDLHFK
jgi:hypothetical protein